MEEKTENGNNELLGNSVPVKELRNIIKQVAPTDVTVLITGESGVGKEVVAKEIHRFSKRNDKPFITVNCGAIPEGIIESELFGHQKGSYTGASETSKGYFETADSGTIFLDEIGELPILTQVKFLRVIESGEFTRVGSSITEHVDVRVIAATNKNLEHQIKIRSFREDLYYRLRSINIYIPPLRERKEDIKLLFDHFVKGYCLRNMMNFKGITDDAMDFIIGYSWPGNIRELKNFTESLLTLNRDKIIEKADVLKQLQIPGREYNLPAPLFHFGEQDEKQLLFRALFELKTDIMDIKQKLEEINNNKEQTTAINGLVIPEMKIDSYTYGDFEQEFLTYFWNKYHGNISRIANKLKVSNRTLYRKFKLYGLRNGKV